jgi:hypothetical protein
VFAFVPVYIEKKMAAPSLPINRGWLPKICRIFFREDRQSLLPFWTWFIDNPQPRSAHLQ